MGYGRTEAVVRKACEEGLSAEATIDAIVKAVEAFRGQASQGDDMTFVAGRVNIPPEFVKPSVVWTLS